jgi:hypothetical protein
LLWAANPCASLEKEPEMPKAKTATKATTTAAPKRTPKRLVPAIPQPVETVEIKLAADTKPAKPAKPAAQPKAPRPNFRYPGSGAEKMDLALLAGGTWEKVAKQAGVSPSVIRSHAKFRAKNGKFGLIENGDEARLVVVEA